MLLNIGSTIVVDIAIAQYRFFQASRCTEWCYLAVEANCNKGLKKHYQVTLLSNKKHQNKNPFVNC